MSYNARLQLASLTYASGSSTLLSLGYNYTSTAVPGNDGQIQSITDNVDNGRSETFTYDAWGRLANMIKVSRRPFGNPQVQWAPIRVPLATKTHRDTTAMRLPNTASPTGNDYAHFDIVHYIFLGDELHFPAPR